MALMKGLMKGPEMQRGKEVLQAEFSGEEQRQRQHLSRHLCLPTVSKSTPRLPS